MPRSSLFNRDVSVRKALRKRRIARAIYTRSSADTWEYYNNLHQYSKNKIHCSCPMCSPKTKRKRGKPGLGWESKRYNYKISEQRKVDAMDADLEENS